jgi:hypothetical protein
VLRRTIKVPVCIETRRAPRAQIQCTHRAKPCPASVSGPCIAHGIALALRLAIGSTAIRREYSARQVEDVRASDNGVPRIG